MTMKYQGSPTVVKSTQGKTQLLKTRLLKLVGSGSHQGKEQL